ncbi:hypothetical protein LTR53_008595 [Teratosphaeriaceae sp. CCFEE 6253]|nr:hypothetical protein LTR53_008595 [Teratosphaeriaceae sp. CCFEE 6253]
MLISTQDAPHISRFNSQSTGNATLVGSDNGYSSPISPFPFGDFSSQVPAVPYTGQWFYLDQVPPKLLKELQRQCDPSSPIKDEAKHPLAKGAAKIKAWARPGKQGIDIKLRQKITAEHDEVTQIRLEPALDFLRPDKPFAVELPETSGEICELAEWNEPQELPAEPSLSRRVSAMFSDSDTLPRYEPRRETGTEEHSIAGRQVESPVLEHRRGRSNSVSRFSFVATPPRGLSLSRPDEQPVQDRTAEGQTNEKDGSADAAATASSAIPVSSEPQTDLERVSSQLQQEREIRTRYESLLQDVREELSKQRHERRQSSESGVKQILTGLKVAKTARYETETDVEPPSPVESQVQTPPRERRSVLQGKRKAVHSKAPAGKGSSSKAKRAGEARGTPNSPGGRSPLVAKRKDKAGSSNGERSPIVSAKDRTSPVAAIPQTPNVTFVEPVRDESEVPVDDDLEIPTVANTGSGPAQRQKLPLITTTFHPASRDPSPLEQNAVYGTADPWVSHCPPHKPHGGLSDFAGSAFAATARGLIRGIDWVQRTYGPEPDLEPGKVRVRWTCACGQQLYDDYIEKRPGAARELEAYLNRPRMHTDSAPTTPASAQSSRVFSPNASFATLPSTNTSLSSNGLSRGTTPGGKGDAKPPRTFTALPAYLPYTFAPEPPWLLTCANEDRHTPKLAHLDMHPQKIRSDRDLALALREHYFRVNRRWWRTLRLRGLTSIAFVQFEVHQNRVADIRKCPDVPAPGHSDYDFQPGDLLPPVGSAYLLHLFRHPGDYDGELITYLRAPKRNGRLQMGVGWGVNMVEGFEAARVWLTVSTFFAAGSLVFAIAWATKMRDVQGAFGVAAYVCTLGALVVGWLQAALG